MRNLLMTVLGMVIISALTGCVSNSEPSRTSSSATTVRSSNNKYHGKDHAKEHGKEHGKDHAKNDHSHACGPAHHWDGSSCVHNGEAKGHDK